MIVIEVLLIVDLFLWFLTLVPVPQASAFGWASGWLAWIAVLLLALMTFAPMARI